MIRLDKYLSQIGIVARRQCPRYLRAVDLSIDGQILTSPEMKIPRWCTLTIDDGEQCREIVVREYVALLLHKTAHIVSSDRDEGKYLSYQTLLSDCPYSAMLHVAGRLDQDTTGLLLCTNDGDLIHRITSPHRKLPKTYSVHTTHAITADHIQKWSLGVPIENTITQPAVVQVIDDTHMHLTIHEGKFHQIKKMCIAVDNPCVALHRLSIGPRSIDGIAPGEWKYLTEDELLMVA